MDESKHSSVIELNNVSFSYKNRLVFRNLCLSIQQGEFIGIFGPNGGGKTTLLKLLMGFLMPQAGEVLLFQNSPKKTRHRIGYVPQIHRTDPDFPITVAELIEMGHLEKYFLFRSVRDLKKETEQWMEKLGLLAHSKKAYGELSGGLAQRVLLARALVSDPDLLILDEPTANIDANSLSIFFETLDQLKGKKTILFVTHDLQAFKQRVSRFLCVQGEVTLFRPLEICEHFILGMYPNPIVPEEETFVSVLN